MADPIWYVTTGGEPQGPMDDDALDLLVAGKTLPPGALVWKQGMEQWQPLATVRPETPGADPDLSTCTVCGKRVGADNLVDLLGHRACAACKPAVVQALREGARPTGPHAISAWREGKRVVTHDQVALPSRCLKCNRPVDGAPMKRKLYWHYPLFYLVLFISPIIYIILAIIVRRRASIDVYICAEHARRRRNFIIAAWSITAVGIVTIVGGIAAQMGWVAGLGFLLIVVAIGVGLFGASICRATRIKDKTVWLSGASREFLESLHPWGGQ